MELAALDIPIRTPGLGEAERGLQRVETLGKRAADGAEQAARALAATGASGQRAAQGVRTLTEAEARAKVAADAHNRALIEQARNELGVGRAAAEATRQIEREAREQQAAAAAAERSAARKAAAAERAAARQTAAAQRAAAAEVAAANRSASAQERAAVRAAAAERAKRAREAGAEATAATGALGGGVRSAAGGLLAPIVALGTVSALQAAAAASDAAESAQRRLNATSRLTGRSLAELTTIADATETGFRVSAMAASDLTTAAVRLTTGTADAGKEQQLLTRWLDLAAARGLTASEAMEALNTTLIGQDEGLNKLGLANPQQIYEKWAGSMGTTAAKMTDVQKRQAIINEVVGTGAKVQGEYAKSLDTSRGLEEARTQALTRAAAAIGRALQPTRDLLNQAATAVADWTANNPALAISLVGAGGVAVAVWRVHAAIQAVNAAMAAGAITAAPRWLTALRGIGTFLVTPAGAALLTLASVGAVAGGLHAFGAGKEAERAAAPRQNAERVAGAAAAGDVVPNLMAAREQEARLLQQIRDAAPVRGMDPKEVEAANARVAQLTRERTFVAELVKAYEARAAAAESAPPPDPATPPGDPKAAEKAIAEQVAALDALADVQALRAADVQLAAQLEAQARAEYERGNVTLARRVELLDRMTTLQTVQGVANLGDMEARAPKVALTPSVSPEAMRAELNERVANLLGAEIDVIPLTLTINPDFAIDPSALERAQQTTEAAFANLPAAAFSVLTDAWEVAASDGWAAAGDVMLKGFGSILSSLGKAMMMQGAVMLKLLPALSNPLTAGPALLMAGAALVALGGILGGIAKGGGGSGGSYTSPSAAPRGDETFRYTIGDPYATAASSGAYGASGGAYGARGAAIVAPAAPAAPSIAATPPPTPQVHHWTVIGDWGPTTQTQIMENIRRAEDRGL